MFPHSSLMYACLCTGVALMASGELRAQDHAGQYEQADIEYGLRLYSGHCVSCHGDGGDAVPGVNLRGGRFRNAESDRDLTDLIRDGFPDTAMTPSDYTASELTALVAYVRSMGDFDLSAVTLGDADRGRAVYKGKGDCGSCHRVNGEGPRVAPDLSDVGAIRTAATLQRSLLDPEGSMLPVNRPVRAVTRDGTVINGRRLNEDTFTVQLIDEQERLVSLEKAELRDYTVLTASAMPSFEETLSERELADLLAYLLSLKGL